MDKRMVVAKAVDLDTFSHTNIVIEIPLSLPTNIFKCNAIKCHISDIIQK